MADDAANAEYDPITFSVILNRLNGIAVEMTLALENAAMTSILGLCRDYSCCLYDSKSRQIAMVDAIPIHTNSMHLVLNSITDFFGDDIAEGDVILCNYSYNDNTHIGDLITLCPVFYEGKHLFWAAAKGHQLDVGAPVPTGANPWARDVWQEGIQIPPVKIYEGGRRRSDIINMYLTNVRYRQALEGDLMAQLGSIWTAERRLHELCEEFGPETVDLYIDRSIDYAAERTKAAIREMPNGVYEAEGWLDSDGFDLEDIPIKCKVTINDEDIEVDFTGSAPQVESGLNASYAVLQAAGGIPIVMAIDPDIPHNEGCLRRVSVKAPEGTICNAKYPAATTCATTHPADVMQDVVCRALLEAIPDKMRAGTARWGNIPMMSGVDETGTAWGHMLLSTGSGGSAAKGADGWPLITTAAAHGGLKTASVEHTELLYPLLVEEWEISQDSPGLGEYIGGPGVECEVRPTTGLVTLVGINDGMTNPPHGALGATAGRGGGHYITGRDGKRHFLPPAFHIVIGPEQSWTGESSGGGGYGDPLKRPIEQVRRDVRDGFYSRERAAEVYGVILSDDRDPVVDEVATEAARKKMLEAREGRELPLATPTEPGASRWLEETMRDGDVVIERALNEYSLAEI